MADSLRTLLTRVDATAPAIQGSASAMMKMYDRSPEVAVVEWRNALHNSNPSQWLPLLYVANEVLQNSKRNRGNKFLEAFSPVLGQSLIFVCQHCDAASVEKIRRTVKIWGDRRVFSVRYINELLKGLEPFRNNNHRAAATATAPVVPVASQQASSSTSANAEPPSKASTTAVQSTSAHAQAAAPSSREDDPDPNDYDDDDDPMDILMSDGDDDDDDDGDDDIFGGSDSGGALKLNVELNFDSTPMQSVSALDKKRGKFKRRRSSTASAGSQSSAIKKARRRSILSTTSLVELWKGVADLEQSFDRSTSILSDIQLPAPEALESLVGDELLEHHKTIIKHQHRVSQQRETLYRIATERRTLEQDAVRYIPWLEAALKQDLDDLEFCSKLEDSLTKLKHIHPAIREARDKRVAEDLRFQREQEAKERRRKEDDEAKKFREAALSKETEAKPGMVWNKVTQEYHYLNTDESWRD
jgi:CID domain